MTTGAGGEVDELLTLAQSLVRIDTQNPPGGERRAAECLRSHLQDAGVSAELQELGAGRANLIARVAGTGERSGLLLSGHLDTVPIGSGEWSVPPLEGVVSDGRLYGRGALDMKGAVAAMAVTLTRIAARDRRPKGDVVLACTAGEEVDSYGARELVAVPALLGDVGMAVIGEPTNLEVALAHRGALWVRVEAAGVAGHSAQPGGVNAIRELLAWLEPLETLEGLVTSDTDPLLGAGRASLNLIGGGVAPNIVPDRAFAMLDFRTLPGQDHQRLLEALRARRPGVEISVIRDASPVSVAPQAAVAAAAMDAVTEVLHRPAAIRGLPFVTDASVFAHALGIPTVILGPGPDTGAHTEDESVEIAALHDAAAIYEGMIDRLLH
jgi:succinyl-diaminopimelate desuccinylase